MNDFVCFNFIGVIFFGLLGSSIFVNEHFLSVCRIGQDLERLSDAFCLVVPYPSPPRSVERAVVANLFKDVPGLYFFNVCSTALKTLF